MCDIHCNFDRQVYFFCDSYIPKLNDFRSWKGRKKINFNSLEFRCISQQASDQYIFVGEVEYLYYSKVGKGWLLLIFQSGIDPIKVYW